MEEIQSFIDNKKATFEKGVKLYQEKAKLNPFENTSKWLKFFNAQKGVKRGEAPFNMLINRLKYIKMVAKEVDKKKDTKPNHKDIIQVPKENSDQTEKSDPNVDD